MANNRAAYLESAKAYPFSIKNAPIGKPEKNQILVRNHAIAVNPVDGKLQTLAIYPLNYPVILGEDIAGEVVDVGPGVEIFKNGDRVLGCTAGFATRRNEDRAFQEFTILETNLTCAIPDEVAFERAVVLPLSVSTAAAGLFNPGYLNLQLPTHPAREPTRKTLLVWGGASSVGSSAIQLAVAAGYEVFSTASARNFEYVRKLGATQVFDYNSPSVVSDIVEACRGKDLAGAFDAVGGSAWMPTVEVVRRSEGVKFIATTIPGFPNPPEGLEMKQVQALTIKDNFVGKGVFEDFLPGALKSGAFVPAPNPLVVGHNLEALQEAVDLLNKGVSAQKVVITL